MKSVLLYASTLGQTTDVALRRKLLETEMEKVGIIPFYTESEQYAEDHPHRVMICFGAVPFRAWAVEYAQIHPDVVVYLVTGSGMPVTTLSNNFSVWQVPDDVREGGSDLLQQRFYALVQKINELLKQWS